MNAVQQPYQYILYVDEAGDDGLKRVRPIDPEGASEWLVIGGVLLRNKYESQVVDWVREIREDIDARQGPALHFRNLSPRKRLRACELLATKPVRAFVICSNKKNMRGWKNERAAEAGGTQWFYNFCVRLMMERVTDLCFKDGEKRSQQSNYLRVLFSKRGGHSYSQTKAYWELLKMQASAGSTFLKKREIKHSVLRFNLVDYVPHTQSAGLQLADIVASAFFQAASTDLGSWDPNPAIALKDCIARENKKATDFGVVLQPTPPFKARLTQAQQAIFKEYGYQF